MFFTSKTIERVRRMDDTKRIEIARKRFGNWSRVGWGFVSSALTWDLDGLLCSKVVAEVRGGYMGVLADKPCR